MADASSRFALPYLQPGQAQKEVFHNEALTTVDALLHAAAQSAGDDDPPGSPTAGQCWIVGSSPTGAWSGHGGAVAAWSEGGWRFIAPREGMLLWVIDAQLWARRGPGGWIIGDVPAQSVSVAGTQVVGTQQPAVASPSGGATVDAEARTALSSLLAAMRAHGLIAT
jgi:hypothetical protein